MSQKYYTDSTDLGSRMRFAIDNIAGNANYGIRYSRIGREYDINDLGINFRTNFTEINGYYSWRTLEPIGKFNRLNFEMWSNYSINNEPNSFADFGIGWWAFAMTRGFNAAGLNGRFEPVETYDFFEPRVFGRYYEFPKNWRIGGFISTDYRKKIAGDIEFSTRRFNETGRYNTYFEIRPRFRISDQFFLRGSYSKFNLFNDVGWAEELDDEIVFGIRDRVIQETTLRVRYIFTPLMGINLLGRYYWSRVGYDSFHALNDAGRLESSSYTGLDEECVSEENNNYNAFTIDTQFIWNFSPGSEMSVVWKNQIFTSNPELSQDYFENLNNILGSDQLNSLSIKILYFLDYNELRKKS